LQAAKDSCIKALIERVANVKIEQPDKQILGKALPNDKV